MALWGTFKNHSGLPNQFLESNRFPSCSIRPWRPPPFLWSGASVHPVPIDAVGPPKDQRQGSQFKKMRHDMACQWNRWRERHVVSTMFSCFWYVIHCVIPGKQNFRMGFYPSGPTKTQCLTRVWTSKRSRPRKMQRPCPRDPAHQATAAS